MKLWATLCRASQDGQVMVESLTECGPLEEGMANHFSILVLRTPWTVLKWQKDRTLEDELPRLVGVQYATGEEQRNSSGRNEEAEIMWKKHPVVGVSGGEIKVWCCKEPHCIGTWNVRSMNQGKSPRCQTADGKSEHWHLRNLIQMTIISTNMGKYPFEEME